MDNLDYGIIGNCKSAALVSKYGSIEWCCMPNFDSSAIFAKILDDEIGGSFEIQIDDSYEIKQEYLWETNILSTVFDNGTDSFQLIDFMPRYPREDGTYYAPPDIIRFFRLISGKPKFTLVYDPRLEFGKEQTYNENKGDYIKSYTKKRQIRFAVLLFFF